jgi:hypothetical protein
MDSVSRLTNQLSSMHTLRHQLHRTLPSIQQKLKEYGQQLDQAGLAGMRTPALVEQTNEQSMFSEGEQLRSLLERAEHGREEGGLSLMELMVEPEKGQEIDKVV